MTKNFGVWTHQVPSTQSVCSRFLWFGGFSFLFRPFLLPVRLLSWRDQIHLSPLKFLKICRYDVDGLPTLSELSRRSNIYGYEIRLAVSILSLVQISMINHLMNQGRNNIIIVQSL